jgi:adenylate cyclase
MRGDLRTARQLAEQLIRLAHDAADHALLAIAHANMQATLYLQGELAAARAHGERALAQFAATPSVPSVFSYGPNPRVHTYNSTAAVLHALGYLDQSRQQNRAAHALAQELGQALTIAGSLNYSANLHGAYGEWAAMQTLRTDRLCDHL